MLLAQINLLNHYKAVNYATEIQSCLVELCTVKQSDNRICIAAGHVYMIDVLTWKSYINYDMPTPIRQSYEALLANLSGIMVEKAQISTLVQQILPQPIAEELNEQICMIEHVLAAIGVPFFI